MLQTELRVSTSEISRVGLAPVRSTFSLVEPDSIMRSRVEERIRQDYGLHFGACVTGFMPRFFCYKHESGATGVIGVRRAGDDSLFLERYLAQPIELTIRDVAGRQVARKAIAEVGQFVVDDPHIAVDFFRDLVPLLTGQGFDWVCFTGTHKIRAILRRIGFNGLPVARGELSVARDSGDDWGTYYENEPVVIVGNLADPAGHWLGGDKARSPSGPPGAQA